MDFSLELERSYSVQNMKWEDSELVILLSTQRVRPVLNRFCIICSCCIPIGAECVTIGIVDRKENNKDRWWCCLDCGSVFEYGSVEDSPEWVQRFLWDNRLTREVWYED